MIDKQADPHTRTNVRRTLQTTTSPWCMHFVRIITPRERHVPPDPWIRGYVVRRRRGSDTLSLGLFLSGNPTCFFSACQIARSRERDRGVYVRDETKPSCYAVISSDMYVRARGQSKVALCMRLHFLNSQFRREV